MDLPPLRMPQLDDFLRGWLKLPDELQLDVLRYALPSGEFLTRALFRRKRDIERPRGSRVPTGSLNSPTIFDTEVLPLLACPVISHLVHDAFYSHNALCVGMFHRIVQPPRSALPFVRRINLQVDPSVGTLQILAKKATRGFGFPDLQSVHIRFLNHEIYRKAERNTFVDYVQDMDPIHFKTKELSLELPDGRRSITVQLCSQTGAFIEGLIMDKMTILTADNKAASERWERFTYDSKDTTRTPIEWFEAWRLGPMGGRLGRMTRKVVQI
jgi:hypothetical protein